MPNTSALRNLLLLLLILILTTTAGAAHAESDFHDGAFVQNRALCNDLHNPAAATWAGYEIDPTRGLPSTGDVAYVRAVVWNNNACASDHAAFWFWLPEGASLAVSAEDPVKCLRGNGTGYVEDVPYSPTSQCLQKPGGTATNLYFGHSELASGWFLEIRVPVRYQKRLDGSLPAHEVNVVTVSDFGKLSARVPVSVAYRPAFTRHALVTNSDPTAKVAFDLTHYFEHGVVDVQYGTDVHDLWQGSQTFATDSTQLATPNREASLPNLAAGATYYWRVRITTATGTYVGPMQSFTTPAATFVQPAPRPPTYCRQTGC